MGREKWEGDAVSKCSYLAHQAPDSELKKHEEMEIQLGENQCRKG